MRIAFVTDIHEDILNLQKAFQKIDSLDCDQVMCLGDISGYSLPNARYFERRNAHECLSMIRNRCEKIVSGNHDLNAAGVLPKNQEGFEYPENWYALDYFEKKALANDQLWLYEENELHPMYKREDIAFLATLPEWEIIETRQRNILISHYVYPNMTGSMQGFYFDKKEFARHFEFMQRHNCFYSFAGHEHADGFYIVRQNSMTEKGFTDYYLVDSPSIIILPAVVSGKQRSGIVILDTDLFQIEAIKI